MLRCRCSNPVVFLNHRSRELPIAKCLNVVTRELEIEAVTKFAGLKQLHEEAARTYLLYRDGFMFSWSVGFNPIRATHVSAPLGAAKTDALGWVIGRRLDPVD